MYAVDVPEKIRVVELLLQHKANPDLANGKGETALHHAVEFENLEAVRRLLEAGCKPADIGLHGLVYNGTNVSLEIMKLLLAAGADVNKLGNRESHFEGQKALEGAKAAYKSKIELIDELSSRRREDWEEKTLERWKGEAQIYQAMIDELSRSEP
jgi:ankyrin repeat protein